MTIYKVKNVRGVGYRTESAQAALAHYCIYRWCKECPMFEHEKGCIFERGDNWVEKALKRDPENFSVEETEEQQSAPAADDPVNHPPHYTAGGIECIDAIEAALTCQKDPMQAWLTGQVLKYLWRWPMKNGTEDLKKAQFYLNRLVEKAEAGV